MLDYEVFFAYFIIYRRLRIVHFRNKNLRLLRNPRENILG